MSVGDDGVLVVVEESKCHLITLREASDPTRLNVGHVKYT